jgi:copper chaperone CopZ
MRYIAMNMAVKNVALAIGGMTCEGCVRSVRQVLSRVPGVAIMEVGVGAATVTIDDAVVTESALGPALERAGFRVLSISSVP